MSDDTAISANDRNIAVLTHLGGIFFSFIPGLLIWLIKKDENAFLGEQGREALNFQITLLIAYMVCYMLMFILIGFLLVAVVWLVNIVLCIVAATHASKGESYRYPLTLRLLN
jgi:uncharacterized Tic20 family protein